MTPPRFLRLPCASLAIPLATAVPLGCSGGDAADKLPSGPGPLGEFLLTLARPGAGAPSLAIAHVSDPTRILWQSVPGRGFVEAAIAKADIQEQRGSVAITDDEVARCSKQSSPVAPVVDEGAVQVRAYLPAGEWVHVWSGRILGRASRGGWYDVAAPLGEPPVFYRRGSAVGEQFMANLRTEGALPQGKGL